MNNCDITDSIDNPKRNPLEKKEEMILRKEHLNHEYDIFSRRLFLGCAEVF